MYSVVGVKTRFRLRQYSLSEDIVKRNIYVGVSVGKFFYYVYHSVNLASHILYFRGVKQKRRQNNNFSVCLFPYSGQNGIVIMLKLFI